MENPNNACILIWFCVQSCFWGLDHYIGVHPWIDGVPITSDIIRRIVDLHHSAAIYQVP